MDTKKFQEDFLRKLGCRKNFALLFDYLPDVYFFAKDRNGRFIMLNQADVEQFGFRHEDEIIGKTDFDIFPEELAKNYRRDDEKVISEQEQIINRVELVPNDDGTVSWFSTNKVPLYGDDGAVIGMAGTMRNLKKASSFMQPYSQMSKVVEFISRNYASKIDVKVLADMIPLSISQFEKKFKKIFRLSPLKFIVNVRVKVACNLLARSNDPLSAVAKRTGFYDASSFSRQFKEFIGISPKDYRTKYGRGIK